jgi:hypothetical protein
MSSETVPAYQTLSGLLQDLSSESCENRSAELNARIDRIKNVIAFLRENPAYLAHKIRDKYYILRADEDLYDSHGVAPDGFDSDGKPVFEPTTGLRYPGRRVMSV